MRRLLVLLLLAAANAFAQTQEFVLPKPDASRFTVQKNLEYKPGLAFDLYRPAGNDVVPVVVFANVGIMGMKDWFGYVGWGQAVAASGLASVHYNATAPGDFEALVAALRARASTLKIDPSRMVLWSGSANVRLGLPAAMNPKNDFIRGAVVYYGDGEIESIRLDLPLFYARAGRDVPQFNQRIDALIVRALAANAPWTVANHHSGVHGFDAFQPDEVSRDIVTRTLAFMKSVTTPATSASYAAGADDAAIAGAFARNEWDAAILGYRRLLAIRDDGENRRRLGIALLETKQYAAALPELERAFQLGRGGIRDTVVPAAEAAAAAGNHERAFYWLERILTSPFSPDVAVIRANPRYAGVVDTPQFAALVARGEQLRNAAKLFEDNRRDEALKLLADAPEGTLNQLGYTLLNRARTDDAIAVFRQATTRFPQSPNAWDSLSEAYERAGAKKEAKEAAQRVLTLADAQTPEAVRTAAAARVERLR